MRIRWRGVARAVAIAAVALVAVRLAPGLLRTPEPPPLAADVGLPRAKPAVDVPMVAAKHRHRDRASRKQRRARPANGAPASVARIGTRRRQRVVERPRVDRHASAPTPERAPEPTSEGIPEPAPTPPPTPGDGSEEFAPH